MGKSSYTIGGRSKGTCAFEDGGGQVLPFWCVRTSTSSITPY